MPIADSPFGQASANAMQALEGTPTPSAPPDPAAASTPAAPPLEPQAATPPPGAPPVEPTPEETVEIKHQGKTYQVPRSQLVELAQKGFDYTQKTQTAAAERRQVQEYVQQVQTYAQSLQQRETELTAFLQDPVRLSQYAQALQAQVQAQQPTGPGQPQLPSVESIQGMIHQQVEQARQAMQQEIAVAQFELETNRLTSEYTAEIDKALVALVEKHPILDSVDDVGDLLRRDVMRQLEADPTDDLTHVKTLLQQAAQKRADKLSGKLKDHQKMEAARQAKLKEGIEPPGGTPPAPPPGKKLKLGSDELRAVVEASIRGA